MILDLGIAKALSGKSTKNDFASIAYSSPERLKTGKMNSHSDLWSAGVVLYEMVVGERPFSAEDTESLEREIKSGRLIEFFGVGDLPLPLQRIIKKALAPNPDMRYATASSFKDDLQRFRRKVRTQAEDDNEYEYELPTERYDGAPTERTGGPQVETWVETESEATRRTIQSKAPAQTDFKTQPMDQTPKPAILRNVMRGLLVVVSLILIGLVANELLVLSAATQLKDELTSEKLKNMDEAWNRFDALRGRSFLQFGISPVRQPIREKLIAQADWVFKDFLNSDSPSVKEQEWQSTKRYLSNAMAVEADNAVTSKLRYAEGHIYRINGKAKQSSNPPNPQEAKKAYDMAVSRFLEAASLSPKWPDPHIGLALVYAYGLSDLAKVIEEMEKLKSLQANLGNREAATLADVLRTDANEMCRKAEKMRNCNQRIDIYEKAREAYEQAIELYKPIINFGNSAYNLNLAQASINRIDQILEALRATCTSQ